MAQGVNELLPISAPQQQQQQQPNRNLRKMGSRRIFQPSFKLQVLAAYRQDAEVRGNQRATARKYNVHRRQVQKWLQSEALLRRSVAVSSRRGNRITRDRRSPSPDSTQQQPILPPPPPPQQQQQEPPQPATLNPSRARLHGDEQQQPPPPPPPQPNAVSASGYQFSCHPNFEYPMQLYHQPPAPPAQQFQYYQPPAVVRYAHEEPMMMGDVKIERASPDSAMPMVLKKERIDDDFSSGISETSASPAPSSMDELPLSPRDTGSSAGSDSEEQECKSSTTLSVKSVSRKSKRRRSFSLRFKLRVLDAYYTDKITRQNQRATARKFDINRRQVQKWLGQEHELRDPTQLRRVNRQRLGSHSPGMLASSSSSNSSTSSNDKWQINNDCERMDSRSPAMLFNIGEEAPVDLSAGIARYCALSPNSYVDTAITPPYSQPGCTQACCNQEQPYNCFSPSQDHQTQQQEQPLCLVKPKVEPVSSTVPTPPAPVTPPKKDAILFKPYLDIPVSKPAAPCSSPSSSSSNNNNCREACNLNHIEVDVNLRPHQHFYAPYLGTPVVSSPFFRYPNYM